MHVGEVTEVLTRNSAEIRPLSYISIEFTSGVTELKKTANLFSLARTKYKII